MNIPLDFASPVPLYHQISEALHYQIAIGALRPGDALPTLREAANNWNVNVHTVGRAYRTLAERGLVESNRRAGTRVASSGADRTRDRNRDLARFLARVIDEARTVHGLVAQDLARMMWAWDGRSGAREQSIAFVECSLTQSREHADEIEARFRVRVQPWVVGPEEPPPGLILATYFHYHDVRVAWPDRRPDLRFVAIRPDPALSAHLEALDTGEVTTLTVCEFEEPKAANIVAELRPLLDAGRREIAHRVVRRDRAFDADLAEAGPVLFPPRVWASLNPSEREHPNAVPLRFFIPPHELDALGEEMGWAPADPKQVA